MTYCPVLIAPAARSYQKHFLYEESIRRLREGGLKVFDGYGYEHSTYPWEEALEELEIACVGFPLCAERACVELTFIQFKR